MPDYQPSKAARELHSWIAGSRMTRAEFARELDIGLTYTYQLLQGRCIPSLALASRIETRTGVACADWTRP